MQESLLQWCSSIVGPCEPVDRDARFHGRSAVSQLRIPNGRAYLKVHADRARWERELHFYGQWAPSLGHMAPRLLGALQEGAHAILLSALPGRAMENLTPTQERPVWFEAGRALARLHGSARGTFFGPCRRDGTPAAEPITDPVQFIRNDLTQQLTEAHKNSLLTDKESVTLHAIQQLLPAFADETPVPTHRDFYPGNWLVSDTGELTGIFDFEFSAWDVAVADFTRSATWDWILRPELLDAMQQGYGLHPSPRLHHQLLVAHAQYALSAITWGAPRHFHGYVQEGRDALAHLHQLLNP